MKDLYLTRHAVGRMAERNISVDAIKRIIHDGEAIKEYPDDKPYPSRLILGYIDLKPIHLVLACHPDIDILITAYEPGLDSWESDYKRRKK